MKYILSIFLLLQCYQTVTGYGDDMLETEGSNGAVSRVRRGGLSMLRLGRGLQMLRLGKRTRPMLNVDRTYEPEDIRYVISLLLGENESRRQIPFPRYGRKDLEWLLERLGQNPGEERQQDYYEADEDSSPREIRPAPRPGRYRRSLSDIHPNVEQLKDSSEDDEDIKSSSERTPPLPRIGRLKEDGKDVPLIKFGQDYYIDSLSDGNYYVTDKRGMNMLRLGRAMPMLRLGKRPFKMLRLGRSEQTSNVEDDKRAMPMLRLGKRPFKMLRLGKRLNSDNENEKRAMAMLRLGRSA